VNSIVFLKPSPVEVVAIKSILKLVPDVAFELTLNLKSEEEDKSCL